MPSAPSPSAEAFWSWFAENCAEFRASDGSTPEPVLDQIQERLHRYHAELFFELGGLPEGPHEFVVTAEGKSVNFNAVTALIQAAPSIPEWTPIAFVPARGFECIIEYGDARIDPSVCWFQPMESSEDPSLFGLCVAWPDYDPRIEEDGLHAVHLILVSGIGELETFELIHHVEVGPLPDDPDEDGYMELSELPDYLNWRLGDQSPLKPSA